jgi:hypothetical protein
MRKILAEAMVLLAFAGCKTKPLYHGTNYQLNEVPEKAPIGPVALEIEDSRPWWEKRYYEGYFQMVLLENLKPSPLPLLAQEIQRQATELPDPPQRARVVLDSFRVVIYDKAKEEEEQNRTFVLTDDFEPEKPEDIFGGILGECIAQIVYGVALLSRDGIAEWGHKERHLHGPPRHIKDEYPEGLNCDIRATAYVEWADGRTQTMKLHALTSGTVLTEDQWSRFEGGDQMGAAVVTAIDVLAKEWATRIKDPTAGEVKKGVTPQFKSYSGN